MIDEVDNLEISPQAVQKFAYELLVMQGRINGFAPISYDDDPSNVSDNNVKRRWLSEVDQSFTDLINVLGRCPTSPETSNLNMFEDNKLTIDKLPIDIEVRYCQARYHNAIGLTSLVDVLRREIKRTLVEELELDGTSVDDTLDEVYEMCGQLKELLIRHRNRWQDKLIAAVSEMLAGETPVFAGNSAQMSNEL